MEIQIMDLVGDLNNKDFTKKQILEKDYFLKMQRKLLQKNQRARMFMNKIKQMNYQ